MKSDRPERVVAHAPGRVNLIGEHTDYNDGLALAFAIEQGVTVVARRRADRQIRVQARDLGERDAFMLDDVLEPRAADATAADWRAFARGVGAELQLTGHMLSGAELDISADLPAGAGLGSSAALAVALAIALFALTGDPQPDSIELATLCSRVERVWLGAQTGLLDQLATLCGQPNRALLIDFRTFALMPVDVDLRDWTLVIVDSGSRHANATTSSPGAADGPDPRDRPYPRRRGDSPYNQLRAECEQARRLLAIDSLRDATLADTERLPAPLDRRVRHVCEENARVERMVQALACGDLSEAGRLLDASHTSLRDLCEASVPAIEHTVGRLKASGAAGARMIGGGFGGSVLALLPPDVAAPADAVPVRPAQGARLL